MLTDGEVGNTQTIIDLVKKNCGPIQKTYLHAFGVGNGADQNLIRGCAFAGLGNFYFIHNDSDIEAKVIESLSKTRLEYLIVKKAVIYNFSGAVVASMSPPLVLSAGKMFNYRSIFND